MQYSTVHYIDNRVHYNTIQYSSVQYSIIHYSTIFPFVCLSVLCAHCTILDASKDTIHLKIFLFHIHLLNFIHILLKLPRKTLDADIKTPRKELSVLLLLLLRDCCLQRCFPYKDFSQLGPPLNTVVPANII